MAIDESAGYSYRAKGGPSTGDEPLREGIEIGERLGQERSAATIRGLEIQIQRLEVVIGELRGKLEQRESFPSSLLWVIGAASAWWAARRPIGWTTDQHLAEPCVNQTSPTEATPAKAVAAYIAESATAFSGGKERA